MSRERDLIRRLADALASRPHEHFGPRETCDIDVCRLHAEARALLALTDQERRVLGLGKEPMEL